MTAPAPEPAQARAEAVYKVGDAFYRHYNGGDHLCVLLSCDRDTQLGVYLWVATMSPIYDGRLGGGATTVYTDADLDKYTILGNIGEMIGLKP